MRKKPPFIKKDDKVIVLTGKEKGKIGTVLKIHADKGRAIVEKVNLMKRHSKPGGKSAQGGIVEKEAPIHWSNVLLMCNKCITPVRIKMQRLEDGRMVRVCRKCGEIVDT